MRLIDADALLEKLKSEWAFLSHDDYVQEVTNAPAIEGEAAVWIYRNKETGYCMTPSLKRLEGFESVYEEIQLYVKPPQPQSVREALEKAARVCEQADKSTHPSDLADVIRAMIEKE